MAELTLTLHPSLRIDGVEHTFKGEFKDHTILEAICQLLSAHQPVSELCILNGKPRPGMLFLAGKTELVSLGLINSKLQQDLEIRIVPILHGG